MKRNETIQEQLSLSGEEMVQDDFDRSALRSTCYNPATALQGRGAIKEGCGGGCKVSGIVLSLKLGDRFMSIGFIIFTLCIKYIIIYIKLYIIYIKIYYII